MRRRVLALVGLVAVFALLGCRAEAQTAADCQAVPGATCLLGPIVAGAPEAYVDPALLRAVVTEVDTSDPGRITVVGRDAAGGQTRAVWTAPPPPPIAPPDGSVTRGKLSTELRRELDSKVPADSSAIRYDPSEGDLQFWTPGGQHVRVALPIACEGRPTADGRSGEYLGSDGLGGCSWSDPYPDRDRAKVALYPRGCPAGERLSGGGTGSAFACAADETGAGAGSTDLSYRAQPTGGVIGSSSGADASIPLASGTNAGLMSPTERVKVDRIPDADCSRGELWRRGSSAWECAAGTAETDLTWSPSATGGTVASSTGSDAVLTLASSTRAGLLAPGEKVRVGLYPSGCPTGQRLSGAGAGAAFVCVPATAVPLDTDAVDARVRLVTDPLDARVAVLEETDQDLHTDTTLVTRGRVVFAQTNTAYSLSGAARFPTTARPGDRVTATIQDAVDPDVEFVFLLADLLGKPTVSGDGASLTPTNGECYTVPGTAGDRFCLGRDTQGDPFIASNEAGRIAHFATLTLYRSDLEGFARRSSTDRLPAAKLPATPPPGWGGGGGGGDTDLGYTPAADGGTVTSSTGDDATIPLADGTNAGLLAPGEKGRIRTADCADGQVWKRGASAWGCAADDTATGGTGLDQAAVDARVVAGTLPEARAGNTTRWGVAKLPYAVSGGADGIVSGNDLQTLGRLDTKLSGIAAGAEVNVQADWDQASSSQDSFIRNKPSVITSAERTKLGRYPARCADDEVAKWSGSAFGCAADEEGSGGGGSSLTALSAVPTTGLSDEQITNVGGELQVRVPSGEARNVLYCTVGTAYTGRAAPFVGCVEAGITAEYDPIEDGSNNPLFQFTLPSTVTAATIYVKADIGGQVSYTSAARQGATQVWQSASTGVQATAPAGSSAAFEFYSNTGYTTALAVHGAVERWEDWLAKEYRDQNLGLTDEKVKDDLLDGKKVEVLTRTAYDALSSKDPDTIYMTTGGASAVYRHHSSLSTLPTSGMTVGELHQVTEGTGATANVTRFVAVSPTQLKCVGGVSGDLVNRNFGTPAGGTGGSPISVSTARQWVRIPISGSAAPYATWDFRFPLMQLNFGGRNNTSGPWNYDNTWYTIDTNAIQSLTAANAGSTQATGQFIEVGRVMGPAVSGGNITLYRVVAFGRTANNQILANLHDTGLQAFPLRIRGSCG